jgi:hypothetical protein
MNAAKYLVACAMTVLLACRPPPQQVSPTSMGAPAAAPPAQAGATAPARAGTVPAGTRLLVRLDDTLDSGRMPAGQRFSATLETDLADATGAPVVPVGTKVFGVLAQVQKAGNVAGTSEMEVTFTDVRIGGTMVPIQTQGVKAVGEAQGKDTARKVAAGALVGAAFGGGSGALKGAAIGGAVALVTRGSQVKLPAQTLLEVSLRAPLTITAASAAGAPPPSDGSQKDCIKQLMGRGFSADEAIKSCGG